MKRNKAIILIIVLAVLTTLSFAGCGKNGGDKPTDEDTPPILPPKKEETVSVTAFLSGIESSVVLTSDTTDDIGSIQITRSKTIDLNGHSLTLSGEMLIGSYTLTIKDSAASKTNKVDLSALTAQKAQRDAMIQSGEDFFMVFISVVKDSDQVVKMAQLPNSAERYTESFALVVPEDNSSVMYTYEYLTPASYSMQASKNIADYLSAIHSSGEALTISYDTDADLVKVTVRGSINIEVAQDASLSLAGDIVFEEGGSLNITLDSNAHLDLTGISPEVASWNETMTGKTHITIYYDYLLGDQAVRLSEYEGWDITDDGSSLRFALNEEYVE